MEISRKYPIGRFQGKEEYTHDEILDLGEQILQLPFQLMKEVKGIDQEELEKQYRTNSWNIRQITHHIADSHLNAFVRFKRVLTEDDIQVFGYLEKKWAELSDTTNMNIQPSLLIIQGIHSRWGNLIKNCSVEDLDKTYHHLEYKKDYPLKKVIALYAWHGEHHLNHIRLAMGSLSIDNET